MNQKCLMIFLVALLIVGIFFFLAANKHHKKAQEFNEVFGVELQLQYASFWIIDPSERKVIQVHVTRTIKNLKEVYHKSLLERQRIEKMSSREFGGAAKQFRKLRELDRDLAKKWGPYIKAKRLAEWWYFDTDLPELTAESADRQGRLFYFPK